MSETLLPTPSTITLKHSHLIRGPGQISFDITNQCNYRCLHCYNRSGENLLIHDELSDDEIIRFVNDIATIKPYGFCFCGGEPLLRKKILLQAAHILASHGITVSLVTNGSLLTQQVVQDLIKAGVVGVQISLDGATAQTHERLRCHKHAFAYSIHALQLLKKSGGFTNIGVAFSPTSFNWNEVKATYELSKKFGATTFRIQPLIPQGRTQQQTEDFIPNPLHYRSIVRTIHTINQNGGIPIEWGDPVDHLIRFRTFCKHCVNFSHIKANGDIAISPYLPIIVGNIRNHSFSDYWNAGLVRIWEHSHVKHLSGRILSIRDFGKKDQKTPTPWFEHDIIFDIIEKKYDAGDRS